MHGSDAMHPLTVMDATTIADVAMSDALMGIGKNVLNQIEAAIGRIEVGSYGQCGTCGIQVPTHPYTIADGDSQLTPRTFS